ncbi:MAG: ABC transporter substrate-binding protein [Myxococcales bacterium]|nr:ABC transporter substrate-binding protein [Myxococcales bacterium]
MPRSLIAGTALLLLASSGALALVGTEEPASTPEAAGPIGDRLVSTNLAIDELLLALVPAERILALSVFADDPRISNIVESAPLVSHRVRPGASSRIEPILALEPSAVLISPFSAPDAERLLRRAGVRVLRGPPIQDLRGIRAQIRWLGEALGTPEGAAALERSLGDRLEATRAAVAGAPRPRVLLYGKGWVAGAGTVFDDLLEVAGGRNAAALDGIEGHRHISLERLFALDPDVILHAPYSADARARPLGSEPSLDADPRLQALRAMRSGRVHRISPRLMRSTSHHVAGAAEAIARALHPDRFEEGSP